MNERQLQQLLEKLIKLPKENEWVEFKLNFHSAEEIGKTISALSNGASLNNQSNGYLVFGVKDGLQTIEGTKFRPRAEKVGQEDIEHWLIQRLNPKIDFRIFEFIFDNKLISLFEIPSAQNQPIDFMHKAYIRIASITRLLAEFPEKERKIWTKKSPKSFEKETALKGLAASDITDLLDSQSYFELLKLPYPSKRTTVIKKLQSEKLISYESGAYSISNLGALLFAKDLNKFESLHRKAVRVIVYSGNNKINTLKDRTGVKGYAVGFEGLITYINDQLPANEEIHKALRTTVRMYPEIAIRELVANAIIHQDFNERGSGPMVEIFNDRIEISNPGIPLITTIRFIDEYQSRNEDIASLLRRCGICEEKGSGIDKVIFNVELFQLPAPEFLTQEKHTKVILYAYQKLITWIKRIRSEHATSTVV